MFRVFEKSFGILLVAVLWRESQGSKLHMTPDDPEISINEGESLELTCTSRDEIAFYYPEDVGLMEYTQISTSPASLEEEVTGRVRKIVFRRIYTIHGDTGWYGCAGKHVNVDKETHDQPDVRWTYVWVKSNTSYFVQTDIWPSITVTAGDTALIPCRPTWPNLNVELYLNHDIKMEMDKRVSYDPKYGFKLRDVSLKDSSYYKCQIDDGPSSNSEINYYLNVLKRQDLKYPKINEQALRHVTRGQTLYVNCTIILESDVQYVLNWSTPQKDARITERAYREPFRQNLQTATSELKIEGVTYDDEGDYECTAMTHSDEKKVKTHITVHDPNVKYINLTASDGEFKFQKKYGERIQWIVFVDGYPPPVVKWLDPKGKEITGSWADVEKSKRAVNVSSSLTMLRINELDVGDMGLYTLQATNRDRMESLNFTLDILAKPIPILEKPQAFYMPMQRVDFHCEIAAFPAPNVSWSFLRAPNYPSFEGSHVINLESGPVIPKSTTFLSVATMDIDFSGHLTCKACNDVGCDLDTNVVLVSDVPDGFGIVENYTQTVGDDVVRTCAASRYNYTSAEWLSEQDEPIVETEKISITNTMTNFTHRSILRISNVSKSDNNSYYVCSAKNDEASIERYDFEVKLNDPVVPYFLETNMNKSQVTIDMSTEGHKTIILQCYVGGMPVPDITWYKDNAEIMATEQYSFLHERQELHINYLLEENSGKYACKATNRFGTQENYEMISIKVKEVSKTVIISMVVLVIICVILVIYFSIKMHRERVIRKQLMEAGLTHFEEGALECLNPELTVDDQAELLPYDKKWEFPREKLKFGKQLGFGAFGVVMKADAQGICEDEAVSTVAVKMVRRSTESTYIRALASELKIMVHLGKHLNVVNLLGACTKNITKRELLVIVEYCRFGNLHNYLLRHRAEFINQIDPASGRFDPTIGLDILARTTSIGNNNRASSYDSNPDADTVLYTTSGDSRCTDVQSDGLVLSNNSIQPGWRSNYHGDYKDQNLKPICTQDLLSWAFQVARGMEYLSQRKVLHGDLAARNILLAENNIVKICDFGLAKTMYKDDNYKKKGDAPLPIKWMAIESIRDRVFSTQSDIWSFGIVLWEFFTLAKTPYPGMEAEKQYQRLIEGYRMEQPEYSTEQVYNIMLQCWKAKPSLRPSFGSLVCSIGSLLEESVKEHYVDLNAPYLDMNTTVLESGKDDYLTMMAAPDHDTLCSQSREYVNSPSIKPNSHHGDSYLPMSPTSDDGESGIFSPRIHTESETFEFPACRNAATSVNSDSECEAVEISPMLNREHDYYLKPINVHERRAEFIKQRNSSRNTAEKVDKTQETSEMGYCNAPVNLNAVELDAPSEKNGPTNGDVTDKDAKNYAPTIIETLDNYVNMPRQKNDSRRDPTASFTNPSYIAIDNNR